MFWRKHYPPSDVAQMARFQIALSSLLLFLNGRLSFSEPLSSRLGQDRLRARREVCRRVLSSLKENGVDGSSALMRIAARQAHIAVELIRQGRFPLDDY